ncbi:MAG: hypothetical protein ACR2ME_03625, partial [Acidimicrobiia bacterium]
GEVLCGLSPGGSRGSARAQRGEGEPIWAFLRGTLVPIISSAATPPTSVGGEPTHHILEREHGGDLMIDPDSPTHSDVGKAG